MQLEEQKNAAEAGPEDQARAESLAALKGGVMAAEPVEGAQAGGASGTIPMGPQEEARDLIKFGVGLFEPLYPRLAQVYTPEVQEKLADVTGPLMAKYNLSLGVIFEKWGAEINFAIVAVPLAGETVKAIRLDNADRAAKKKAEEEAAKAREAAANANQ